MASQPKADELLSKSFKALAIALEAQALTLKVQAIELFRK